MNDLVREVEAEAAAERAKAIDWMKNIHNIELLWKPLDDSREAERKKLKDWMALNADSLEQDERGNPILHDGELDETYVLTTTTSHGYDLISAAEAHPEDVVNAAKAGWLKADHDSVKKHPGAAWVDRLKRYYAPASGSTRLEKKK